MNDKDYQNALYNILSDKISQEYIIEILKFCNPTNIHISDNPRKDVFVCGIKSVGSKILNDILQYSPEKYTEIVQKMKGFK